MSISRRSFLKLAGLTAVSVAGASMFTGCTVMPEVEVTLVDESKTVGWKDNKAVSSAKLPWFIVNDATKEADAEKTVTDALKNSNKLPEGKKVKITNAVDGKIKVDKSNEKKFTLEIHFDLVDA